VRLLFGHIPTIEKDDVLCQWLFISKRSLLEIVFSSKYRHIRPVWSFWIQLIFIFLKVILGFFFCVVYMAFYDIFLVKKS
jgi:hypothetical protein